MSPVSADVGRDSNRTRDFGLFLVAGGGGDLREGEQPAAGEGTSTVSARPLFLLQRGPSSPSSPIRRLCAIPRVARTE